MSWILLFLAGLCEVGWALGFKLEAGFGKPWILALTVLTLVASMWLLSLAMKDIAFGTVYAVWTGIGVLGTFILGVLMFHDPITPWRAFSVLLVLRGRIGLKLSEAG